MSRSTFAVDVVNKLIVRFGQEVSSIRMLLGQLLSNAANPELSSQQNEPCIHTIQKKNKKNNKRKVIKKHQNTKAKMYTLNRHSEFNKGAWWWA